MIDLLKNDEAVSELIGAMLILVIVVIFIGIVQVQQVPVWNKQVELQHIDVVYDDFLKLKTNIEVSSVYGFPKSSIIHMGAIYPNRVVFRNPGRGTAGTLNIEPDKWIRINYTSHENLILFEEDYEVPGFVVLTPYNGIHGITQHSEPSNMEINSTVKHNNTYALNISGNDWREQTFTSSTLTLDAIMTVWIRGDVEAELQAIGVAYGNGSGRPSILYKIWGTESMPQSNWVYTHNHTHSIDNSWYKYELPIGADWNTINGTLGPIDRIVYIQDNDGAPSSGLMYMDDIIITGTNTNIVSENFTSNSVTFNPNYYYYSNSPNIVYEHGIVLKDFSNVQNYSYVYSETPQSLIHDNSISILYVNNSENDGNGTSISSSEPKTLNANYVENSSNSAQATNVTLTIHTSYPTLWQTFLNETANNVTVNGNDVIVTCSPNITMGIATREVDLSSFRGVIVSTITTPTPPDLTPPASITSLTNDSYAKTYIDWSWTNPGDSDFSHVMIYIDGVWDANTSSNTYTATGFNSGESHTISTHTVDNNENVNGSWVNHTAVTGPTDPLPDTTPPASITSLTNDSYAKTYIDWSWTNPGDSDFSHVMIYIDGVWESNTSSNTYTATGFSGGESHTISTHTVDDNENVNSTWVNHTAITSLTDYTNWWNTSWTKRRPIDISNGGTPMTDYQIVVNVPYDSDMQPDFDDIRFASNDGSQELSYWIQNKTNSSDSNVWIKVPSIAGDGITTIYMYYSNPLAINESSFTDTYDAVGESGTIDTNHGWMSVSFNNSYSLAPVTIVSPMTYNQQQEGVARINNLANSGFDVRFEEYPTDNPPGVHNPPESFGWVALKSGNWRIGGLLADVGQDTTTNSYSTFSFDIPFSSTPTILTQINSFNEADFGSHTRNDNPSSSSIDVKIEEETDTAHASETIGYVAIEPGMVDTSLTNGTLIEAGNTPNVVTHNWYTVTYPTSFSQTPVIVSKIMTEDGSHNSHERMRNPSTSTFQVRIQETPSYDGSHTTEVFGWFAADSGSIYGRQYMPTEPVTGVGTEEDL